MKSYIYWIAALVITTVMFGTVYAGMQFILRAGANDPQIQMAQDTATKLNENISPSVIVGPDTVNVAQSLSPTIIIYDKLGKIVAGTAMLNDKIPVIPKGVLNASNGRAYNAVTWQPAKGVRLAAVAVSTKKYYVVSLRNMHEVEHREGQVFQLTAAGYIVAIATIGAAYFLSIKR